MEIKPDAKYDVAIIGAGPAGIYTSIKLAEAGLQVLVIEEDTEVGRPRFCTGLISKEAFDRFCLPKEAIEGEFHSAWIFSPLGARVCLKSNTPVYVTNRTTFDQGLYRLAKEKGVEFLLNCHCLGLKVNDNYTQVRIIFDNTEITIRSKVAILATGIKYNLHRCINLMPPEDFLDCSQTQVSGESDGDIEIFMGNSIAPHSFAWIVPLKDKKLRIGLSTRQNSLSFLKSFLKYLRLKGRIHEESFNNIIRRPIPLGVVKNTYASRILVVGDAAGQVKPTTGGGIYFGLICADLAARTIIDAFRKNDFSKNSFRRYEIEWKKKIEFDLTMSLYFRKLIAHFNDGQIEKFVQFCSEEPIQRLIEKYADFNHHGRFIKELIKKPAFWKNLHQILTG